MNNPDIRNWLWSFRTRRNVCMLIPMEAAMGYPIEIKNAAEYLIPFYRLSPAENCCYPPFAYIRASYPGGGILTYSELRTLPGWRGTDWNTPISLSGADGPSPADFEDYYGFLDRRIAGDPACVAGDPDDLLCRNVAAQRKGLLAYYELLIQEKNRYQNAED